MKKSLLVLIFSIFSLSTISAQEKLSETERLVSLAKIYGFLKYYHPEVAKGTYNWDEELLKQLPEVLKATDKESLSAVYTKWIDSLGKVPICKKCDSKEQYFEKNFDLSWIEDGTVFNNEVAYKLKYIENNRNQKKNYYVDIAPVGNIKVTNEPDYKGFDYPTEEYRLLGLFKYWNIIEYFFPYKHLTDQKWDLVLEEMIPKFQNTLNKSDYQLAISELIAKLDDSHAYVRFTTPKRKYLPIKISNIDNKPVVSGYYNDSLAKINNLMLGDVILKINGLEVATEAEKILKYFSGSNSNAKIRDAYFNMLMGTDDMVTLSISRNGQDENINVKRYDFADFSNDVNRDTETTNEISTEIGYINMAYVRKGDVEEIFKNFKNKKSIIIDLRNYPAYIFYPMTAYLNSEKRKFVKVYKPNTKYPGKYHFRNYRTKGSKKAFKGKIVLIVSEESISRSEFTAMAFQTADNVTTVGNQTEGADGDVVGFDYLGGFRTAISGNGILYPDGSQTQRKGIKIDVVVKPTISGLEQARDEVLEKAIEVASE